MPALAVSLAAPGWAQTPRFEPPGAVAQVARPSTPADDVRSGQIGHAGPQVATGVTAGPRDVRPAPQLAAPGDAATPPQLVREGRTARGSTQLSGGPPSAQPPAPLSSPAEGRTGAVARVEGSDRCDPAARAAAARSVVLATPAPVARGSRAARAQAAAARVAAAKAAAKSAAAEPLAALVLAPAAPCRAVIETRGAEFPPPGVEPLSPEQRLLVEQRQIERRAVEANSIARTAARRIGRDGADAGAPEMQGLASVVLGATPAVAPTPDPTTDPTAGLTPEQAAIAVSVLGGLGSGQQ